MAISVGSAGIKHYLNLREKGQLSVWVMPISIIMLLAVAFVTAPSNKIEGCEEEITFNQVNTIIQNRCVSCHSETPTDQVWKTAPNGVKYDTKDQIVNLRDKIFQRVVVSKNMPLGNQTGMTQKERELIECWIHQQALK